MPPSPSVHHIPSLPAFTSRARLARLSSKDTAALFNLSPFRVNQAEYNCKAQVKITTFRHSSKIQNLSITWTLITASTTLASSLSFLGKALLAKHQELNWLTWFLLEVSLLKTWPPSPSWSRVGWALPKTFQMICWRKMPRSGIQAIHVPTRENSCQVRTSPNTKVPLVRGKCFCEKTIFPSAPGAPNYSHPYYKIKLIFGHTIDQMTNYRVFF